MLWEPPYQPFWFEVTGEVLPAIPVGISVIWKQEEQMPETADRDLEAEIPGRFCHVCSLSFLTCEINDSSLSSMKTVYEHPESSVLQPLTQ